MTIYLHKILPLLASPLMAIFLLILLGLWLNRRGPIKLALVMLLMLSLPVLSPPLIHWVEGPVNPPRLSELPKVQSIVVLSGMLRVVDSPGGKIADWNDAADRFFAGLELYRAAKAPQIIFTAEMVPWEQGTESEGHILARNAKQWGIPQSAIRVTDAVQNTADEAIAVQAMLGPRPGKIILVTSAYHMNRAVRLFAAQGLQVIPYPIDFRADSHKLTLMDFLPSAQTLATNTTMIREWMGRMYYAVRP